MGKVIGILGLKGGVGKTSSVVSLGAALTSFGKKVLLVDANFSAPNLGFHLNLFNPKKTIHHVLRNEIDIYDSIHKVGGMDLIPASLYPKKNYDPLKLKEKIKKIKKEYDFILIDSSPSLNNETLATMLSSDELLVVSTPDYSTLGMTLKAINLSRKQGARISGIILNKVYNKNFELSLEDIEKTSGVPVLAVLPHDKNVMKSQSLFSSILFFKPFCELSHEYKRLAASISGEKYTRFRIRELFKINPKKQDINRELFYQNVF